MVWPAPQDYNEAVQNPRSGFGDSALQAGAAAVSVLGLPLVSSGNFASVYQFHCGSQDFAVRCFLQSVQDQYDRYEKISRYIMTDDLPYTVNFEYLQKGIRIHGQWFPILKMDWVRGESLDTYVKRVIRDNAALRKLIDAFVKMVADLRSGGIAHGDLQHGNILVLDSGELRLVDYDGMYVPDLKGLQSNELGHRNYQHPARTSKDFDDRLDNFSAWSIFTSLSCLAKDPGLLEQLRGGDECLLFKHADYKYPMHSRAFAILEHHDDPEIRTASQRLRTLLNYEIANIPFLGELFHVAENLPPMQLPSASASEDAELLDWREQVDVGALDGSAGSALQGWYRTPGDAPLGSGEVWPTLHQYVLSFSNAAAFFNDLELRMSHTERLDGKIRPLVSNDTAVFKMKRGTQSFAVKVFLHPDKIREERYEQLMKYMHSHDWPINDLRKYFVYCDYIPKGINVGGHWYPILKSYWEEGKTLAQFVADEPNYAQLESVLHQFRALVELMEANRVIHGNLEPTNLIRGEQGLKLIDYDTLYTPNMIVPTPRARQQKLRQPGSEPDSRATDAFAAWIIDTALVAVLRDARMFRFATPDKMIIDSSDFKGESPVLSFMEESGRRDLKNRSLFLKALSKTPPSEMPILNYAATISQQFAQVNALPFETASVSECTIDGVDPSPRYLNEFDFSATANSKLNVLIGHPDEPPTALETVGHGLKVFGTVGIVVLGVFLSVIALHTGSGVIALCFLAGTAYGIDKLWRT